VSDTVAGPSQHAIDLLNSLLKQITTLGVASIGFLFSAIGARYVPSPVGGLFYLSLAGFCISVVLSVIGQIALVSVAFKERKHWWFPGFLLSGRLWFLLAWAVYAIAIALFFGMVLPR